MLHPGHHLFVKIDQPVSQRSRFCIVGYAQWSFVAQPQSVKPLGGRIVYPQGRHGDVFAEGADLLRMQNILTLLGTLGIGVFLRRMDRIYSEKDIV